MKYQNDFVRKLIIENILGDGKSKPKIYYYIDKKFIGLIAKLKYNPILIFLWYYWNKIAMKKYVKFWNTHGEQLNRLTEAFVKKFIWNRTIERSD